MPLTAPPTALRCSRRGRPCLLRPRSGRSACRRAGWARPRRELRPRQRAVEDPRLPGDASALQARAGGTRDHGDYVHRIENPDLRFFVKGLKAQVSASLSSRPRGRGDVVSIRSASPARPPGPTTVPLPIVSCLCCPLLPCDHTTCSPLTYTDRALSDRRCLRRSLRPLLETVDEGPRLSDDSADVASCSSPAGDAGMRSRLPCRCRALDRLAIPPASMWWSSISGCRPDRIEVARRARSTTCCPPLVLFSAYLPPS